MPQTVSIGYQDFETIRKNNYFYIDKTRFIREWWERGDSVTLITRPRRFGKTLTLSMVEKFFSVSCASQGELFEGLSVWEEEKYRKLQGTWPVIALSFADVKEVTFEQARKAICRIIKGVYNKCDFLLETDLLNENEKNDFRKIAVDMEDNAASVSLKALSDYLCRYYGKKVIILLDEYDTPVQEAYVKDYWEEMTAFIRSLFNATFKTNACLERGIMSGITRISKESVFSDLNNLKVVTTTSEEYADIFGFTEDEVFQALEAFGLSGQKEKVKSWYDGFSFGSIMEIYNPWSIINYLDTGKLEAYWANSSSNALVRKLIQEGNKEVKQEFEKLLKGESVYAELDEQVVYDQLDHDEQAIWSFLLAGGYLKVRGLETPESEFGGWTRVYELGFTNFEVRLMFRNIIHKWFGRASSVYNDFIKALLMDDLEAMNVYMNEVAMATFSYFDTGKNPSGKEEPERFYHGFVLGLMVELSDRYILTSNRESGFGRYDVMLEPRKRDGGIRNSCDADDAVIMEFKVRNEEEKDLSDTVKAALKQIEKKNYEAALTARGVPGERIRKYGFAFCGKTVLIGRG